MRTRTMLASTMIATLLGGIAIADPPRDDPPGRSDLSIATNRGRLGIAALPISPELRAHFGAPNSRGVLVDHVRPDGPAARAGLRVGDVVVEVDGAPTRSARDILDALSDRKKGMEVGIAVIRAGEPMSLRAMLDNDPGVTSSHRGSGREPDSEDEMRRFMDEAHKRMQELDRRRGGELGDKI